MKKFLLALPIALTLGAMALPAHAGTSVGIAIGEPYPGYAPYSDYHPWPVYGGEDQDDDDEDQISCWEGKRAVRQQGYYQVQPLKCEGSFYRYRAIRGHRTFIVRVDSYSADILSVRQVGYN